MKKSYLLLIAAIFIFIFKTSSQTYYVYDGDAFNVMFECNSSDNKVYAISFTDAEKTKWIKFDIIDVYIVGDTDKEGGFTYEVSDGKKDYYYIDYFKASDYVEVSDESYFTWTLYRRK